MPEAEITFTVFTKLWRLPLPELGAHIRKLGFDGVELPVRPGYPVTPENVTRELPQAVRILKDFGLKIGMIAGDADEKTIAACGASGIPIIRICADIPGEKNYLAAIDDIQRGWDALVPVLARHNVAIGVQNHCGRCIANAMQVRHAIGKYDPAQICLVWDPAHNALEGEAVDIALDTVWSHLRVVNLKSGYWQRTSPPEAELAQWRVYWTTGRHGRTNWPWVARELLRRGFCGDVCLTAEYSDREAVDRLIVEDFAFAKSLFKSA